MQSLTIAYLADYYSPGMGYVENMLPKWFVRAGHRVHVLASEFNVYGTDPNYRNFAELLGPARESPGTLAVDGYWVHRLPTHVIGSYVCLHGLGSLLRRLKPDVIQAGAAAGLNTFRAAAAALALRIPFFTACHQAPFLAKAYAFNLGAAPLRGLWYRFTRTLPGAMVARGTVRCYVPNDGCAISATKLYGVPPAKVAVTGLASDTELFYPVESLESERERKELRSRLGFEESEVVCIYTGQLDDRKQPMLLARAVAGLRQQGLPFRALFIGGGPVAESLAATPGCMVLGWKKHCELPPFYRACDISVWPALGSISMYDAAACGLPFVVPQHLTDRDIARGNSVVFRDNDLQDLQRALRELLQPDRRRQLGHAGAHLVRTRYSWRILAEQRLRDYVEAVQRYRSRRIGIPTGP
jgi:glycosyltransferase involved in cell wall biosynthesis